MKYFNCVSNLNELRSEYKKLIKKYHPDNGGSVKATQEINSEYELLFTQLKRQAETGLDSHTKQPSDSFNSESDTVLRDIINKIINFNIDIEIIGCWIWVTGDTYSVKDELKGLKFQWSGKRKAWYFHSEPYKKRTKKILSLDEIRNYYGSEKVSGNKTDILKIAYS